jgi:hypothetical protein
MLSRVWVTTETGFGLVTRFIAYFGPAHDYVLFKFHCYTHTHTSVHSHVFKAVASQRLPTADVPLPLGSRTIPVAQLQVSNSNGSQRLNRSSSPTHSLTNQLVPLHPLSPLHCTALHSKSKSHCD